MREGERKNTWNEKRIMEQMYETSWVDRCQNLWTERRFEWTTISTFDGRNDDYGWMSTMHFNVKIWNIHHLHTFLGDETVWPSQCYICLRFLSLFANCIVSMPIRIHRTEKNIQLWMCLPSHFENGSISICFSSPECHSVRHLNSNSNSGVSNCNPYRQVKEERIAFISLWHLMFWIGE